MPNDSALSAFIENPMKFESLSVKINPGDFNDYHGNIENAPMVTVILPPKSQEEMIRGALEKVNTLPYDASFEFRKPKHESSKGTVDIQLRRGSKQHLQLEEFSKTLGHAIASALRESNKAIFGDITLEDLQSKMTLVLSDKSPEMYPPKLSLSFNKDFDGGYVVSKIRDDGKIQVKNSKVPDFAWDTIEKYLVKGTSVVKARCKIKYCHIRKADGGIGAIKCRLHLWRLYIKPPICAMDDIDSDCVGEEDEVEGKEEVEGEDEPEKDDVSEQNIFKESCSLKRTHSEI